MKRILISLLVVAPCIVVLTAGCALLAGGNWVS